VLAKAPDRLEDCRLEQPTRPGGKSKQDDTQSTLAGSRARAKTTGSLAPLADSATERTS
jgi:hypothetical protein